MKATFMCPSPPQFFPEAHNLNIITWHPNHYKQGHWTQVVVSSGHQLSLDMLKLMFYLTTNNFLLKTYNYAGHSSTALTWEDKVLAPIELALQKWEWRRNSEWYMIWRKWSRGRDGGGGGNGPGRQRYWERPVPEGSNWFARGDKPFISRVSTR